MRDELRKLDWNELFRDTTADQSWTVLKSHVDDIVKKFVPERRRRNHNKPPWLSREILRAIRRKKKAVVASKEWSEDGGIQECGKVSEKYDQECQAEFREENCKRLRL
jgi:hypothetical protein